MTIELPHWEDGTVAVLSTCAAHAIPVSTAIRTGPRTIHLALALRRESLARLGADPRVALTLLARGIACTAHATATVVAQDERIATVRLDVDAIQDHRQPTFEIEDGVRWRWVDPEAEARDAELRAALAQRG